MSLAVLSDFPETLHTLWNEFEFGLENKKPAKDFTSIEQGRVKYIHHNRNVVWDNIGKWSEAVGFRMKHVIKFTKCMDRIQLLLTLLMK